MTFCTVCWAFVPVVRQSAGRALGGVVAGAFGVGARTAAGKILGILVSLVAGHLVDQAAGLVCGQCGLPVRPVA